MDSIVNMLIILLITSSIGWALGKLSLRSRSSSQPARVPVRVEVSTRVSRYQRWDDYK